MLVKPMAYGYTLILGIDIFTYGVCRIIWKCGKVLVVLNEATKI
jgi:hypothetical protein